MLEWLEQKIQKEHERRTQQGLLRSLPLRAQGQVDFSSNDYLGLTQSPKIVESGIKLAKIYGAGSTGSRLTSGNYPEYEELEQSLADWLNSEAVLIFNSGYQMNSTIFQSIVGRDDRVFIDRLAHNSLLNGVKGSGAIMTRFNHNDVSDLENHLKKISGSQHGNNLIVVESVYSMDGDKAPVKEISALARRFDALLVVDEAHAIGVLGEQGRGVCREFDGADIVLGTFGKSFGVFGSFVAGSHKLIEHLKNTCGGFIYTTALPPFVIGCITKSLELLKRADKERGLINELGKSLKRKLNIKTEECSDHIIPIVVGDSVKVVKLQDHLRKKGIRVNAIRYPTVPKHTDRLRISVTAKHSSAEVEQLAKAILSYET